MHNTQSYNQEYYKKNRALIIKNSKIYYLNNKEKIKLTAKHYRISHPNRTRPIKECINCHLLKEHMAHGKCKACYNKEYDSIYYIKNRERIIKRTLEYANKNPIQKEKHKISSRLRQRKNRDKNRMGARARAVINGHVKRGNILPPRLFNCKSCGNKAEQYHHHKGYNKEYQKTVVPLCRKCHGFIHRKYLKKSRGDINLADKNKSKKKKK